MNNIYEAMYDALQDGLYAFDKNGKIVHVNKAMTKILGYTKEELIGSIGHDIFHLHAFNQNTVVEDCPIYKAFLKEEHYVAEEFFRKKDGSDILVEVSCSPIFEDNNLIGYVVLFKDITEKRKNEEKILALNKVVQESQNIIVIKDLDLKVIATNKAFANAAGEKSVSEMIGKTDAQIFDISEELEPIKSYMENERKAQALKPGEYIKLEEPVIYPDGTTKIFSTIKFPIFDNAKVIATANISTDISKEKSYEKHLEKRVAQEIEKSRESDLFYNKIFETANLGICLTNSQGIFTAVNPEYCNIYGYSKEELVGNHFTMVVPPEHRDALIELHDKFIFEKEFELSQEWEVVRKDGEKLHILATAGYLDNVIGGPYKITTVSDITESYKLRELQKKQEVLIEKQSKMAAMGEMIDAIAHQWKQPLGIIKLKSDYLMIMHEASQSIPIKEAQDCSDSVQEQVEHLLNTLDEFRNFLRPNKTEKIFSVQKVLNSVTTLLKDELLSTLITVNINVIDDIEINGLENEFKHVIINIINNAKDAFMENSIKNRTIDITLKNEENLSRITLQDNAGGIPINVIDNIFDANFTTKSDDKGTGIGLYMSQQIINKLGANIYVENRDNGACFIIDIDR